MRRFFGEKNLYQARKPQEKFFAEKFLLCAEKNFLKYLFF